MTFKIEFAWQSDAGKIRKNNEDSALVDQDLALAIVADGMGGHNSGEVASSLAVKVTRDKYDSMRRTNMQPAPFNKKFLLGTNQLGFAVQLANSVIYEAGNSTPDNKGMGTTLTSALLNGDRLCSAHIGDSRLYLFRSGALKQITEDHSLVMDHVRKGLITVEQAEKSPLQNILTRALGSQKNPVIDLSETVIQEGDRLLMCTDGLFKAVSEQKTAEILKSSPDDRKACELLVETANINGGPDNITVITGTVYKKNFKEKFRDMFKESYA
ncbi:MAG TPA: Stp1/IreP family PP2C-type Ser/Thr phosphatase [Elusimicrobia bacterium]|nr:Stp1/IreP family PP2C-type Ser/Thr phosphatase [Elusimicrobiota bacterium]